MDWVAFLVSDKSHLVVSVSSAGSALPSRPCRFFPGTREAVSGVQPDTASNYVSHLTSVLRATWGVDCMLHWPRLSLYLRHLRTAPQSRHFKFPFTKSLLVALMDSDGIDLGVRVACLVGFQGLFRVSEFVSCSRSRMFAGGRNLLRSDISFVRVRGTPAARVYLRGSKTDPHNLGREFVFLSSPGSPLCPVYWLVKYFAASRGALASGPAFVHCSRSPVSSRARRSGPPFVTAADVRKALKDVASRLGQDASRVSAHSLRIGGAMALVEAGIPLDDIRILGRWRSDAFLQYVRMTWTRLQAASRAVSVPGDDPVVLRAGR